MNTKLTLVYQALKNGGWNPRGTGAKGSFRAICPCCGTRETGNASKLSVAEGERAPVLIHCFGGCGAIAVIQALGLEPDALFPDRPSRSGSCRWIDPYVALAGLADDAFTVAVFAAEIAHGGQLSEAMRDELAEARYRIDSTLKLVKRG